MPDMEKVVKALECLKEGSYCECCDYKPYDDCIKRVATDAIALLKEQEPRLLNYDEISDHECVYMEFYGKKDIYPSLNYEARTWAKEKYGQYWRVWSNKPTEEQRRSVKWE